MELIIILIIFVTAFVIAVNTRKKHVSMENNVSPNNIPLFSILTTSHQKMDSLNTKTDYQLYLGLYYSLIS